MTEPEIQPQGTCMENLLSYLRTTRGKILAVESVLCLVVIFCFIASHTAGYLVLPIVELVFCIVYFIVYANDYHRTVVFIHWGWSNFLRAIVACVIFIILSLLVLARSPDGPAVAGSVFGIIAGTIFGYDTYLLALQLKKSSDPKPIIENTGEV